MNRTPRIPVWAPVALVLGLITWHPAASLARPHHRRRPRAHRHPAAAAPAPISRPAAPAAPATTAAPAHTAAPGPTPIQPGLTGKEHPVKITLAEAVRSALAQNPQVKQLALDTEIARTGIDRERAQFGPIFRLEGSGRRDRVYNEFRLDPAGPDVLSVDSYAVEAGLGGTIPWGGRYQLRFTGEDVTSPENPTQSLSPRYQTSAALRYTQPLLRGAGPSPSTGRIDRARLNLAVTRSVQRRDLEALALRVVQAYWTLVLAREDVRISGADLSQAITFREAVSRRVRAGQDPRSELVQADATIAQRRQAAEAARLVVIDAERDLLGLIYLGRSGRFAWDQVLVPVDRPPAAAPARSFDRELAVALAHRPEVKIAARTIERAQIDLDIANNDRRIQLDVFGEAGLRGVSGTAIPAALNGGVSVPDLLSGGAGHAVGVMPHAPFFGVGVTLEIPLDNDDRAGAARQARMRLDKARAVDVRTQVALDVRAALQRLRLAAARLDSARKAATLAASNVEAQRKRYQGGAGTVFDVLRAQDDLAAAQAESVRAQAEQAVALARLDAARGTLLDRFGVRRP